MRREEERTEERRGEERLRANSIISYTPGPVTPTNHRRM